MQVLDVTDREFWPPRVDDGVALVREWLAVHDVDTADVRRVEVHVVDCALLRVYRYARNEDGERFVDPKSLEDGRFVADSVVAELPPLDVALRIPPPVPLRTVGPED
jgi:hypothetical protein